MILSLRVTCIQTVRLVIQLQPPSLQNEGSAFLYCPVHCPMVLFRLYGLFIPVDAEKKMQI